VPPYAKFWPFIFYLFTPLYIIFRYATITVEKGFRPVVYKLQLAEGFFLL